jgi:hypothetical protein
MVDLKKMRNEFGGSSGQCYGVLRLGLKFFKLQWNIRRLKRPISVHSARIQREARLNELGISEVPTAYRKIPMDGPGTAGKCNTDFAHDLFEEVRKHEQCTVVALDIRKDFESVDHKRLYRVWSDRPDEKKLPADHLAVLMTR